MWSEPLFVCILGVYSLQRLRWYSTNALAGQDLCPFCEKWYFPIGWFILLKKPKTNQCIIVISLCLPSVAFGAHVQPTNKTPGMFSWADLLFWEVLNFDTCNFRWWWSRSVVKLDTWIEEQFWGQLITTLEKLFHRQNGMTPDMCGILTCIYWWARADSF